MGNKEKITLLIVLGSGGHTAQMIELVNLLGKKYNYEYIIAKEDVLSEKKIKIKGEIYKIRRTREVGEGVGKSILKQIKGCLEVFPILKKLKAKAIISCGPHISIPICFIGRLLGKKIIYIEDWSRIYTKSSSGKLIYKFADLFFVQWKEMEKQYPKSIYAGRFK